MIVKPLVGMVAVSLVLAAPSFAGAGDKSWVRDRVNTFRQEHNLGKVSYNRRVQRRAQHVAELEAEAGRLKDDTDGSRAACKDIGMDGYGSNAGYGPDVEHIESAFERSPEHRKNLLDPQFVVMGVGLAHGHGLDWLVQDFCSPE